MSLFGTSPPDSPSAASAAPTSSRLSSLFDDPPSLPTTTTKSSLFADDDTPSSSTSGPPTTSPWAMPAPKKAARGELLRSLLPAADVPDTYVDYFDSVLRSDDAAAGPGRVGPVGVGRVLSAGSLGAEDQMRIMNILAPGGQTLNLGRNEFNVLLALVGLAQEREDITLDSVDERRRNLPVPKLGNLATAPLRLPGTAELAAKPAQRPKTPPAQVTSPAKPVSTTKTRPAQKASMDETDPWGSPALHKNHNHDTSRTNGSLANQPNGVQEPVRSSLSFSTASIEQSTNGSSDQPSDQRPPVGSLWSSYTGTSSGSFSNAASSALVTDGFGGDSGGDEPDRPARPAPPRAFGGGRVTGGGVEELILVSLLPEKEGMFMFQHHNYQVSSSRRNSKVVRRFSDFVWLLDCLQKRYPFRQLPLLPPKRVAVNGNHLAADNTFIEKRRRGLARFANALVRHPLLSQEQLVVMFLTVPTIQELAVWRKQATISVQEEFQGRLLPPGLEDSLSPTLNDLFETTRTGIRRSAEAYIAICNLMDRLSKRTEGLASDHLRLSGLLETLSDASQDTYATDTNDVPLLNEGLRSTAKHLSTSQNLLQDEARAWDEGVLEDLKRQRDALVSVREMFDRRDRYDRDNIPYLEKRIQANESKLAALRQKPEGMVKPGEVEKVAESIIKDKESIVAQHARGVLVKECIRDELIFFQQSQYHVSRWSQDWAQERVKYAELQADNWRQLVEQLESMPVGE